MAKKKPRFRLKTYGIYTQWDSESRELPRVLEVTTRIPGVIDVEFGFVANVKGGKNIPLQFCIAHPGIKDKDGAPRPPFAGQVFAKTNDWDFFLGDTIWAPVIDKLGNWRLTLSYEENVVIEKTFEIYS